MEKQLVDQHGNLITTKAAAEAVLGQTYLERFVRGEIGDELAGERLVYRGSVHSQIEAYEHWPFVFASRNAVALAQQRLRLYAIKTRPGQSFKYLQTQKVRQPVDHYLRKQPGLSQWTSRAAEIEEVMDHPFLTLMREVNPFHNQFDLIELTSLFLDITGNSYWLLVFNRASMPAEIWPIPSQFIEPIRDEKKIIGGYRYQRQQQMFDLQPWEVIHHKFPNPYDPLAVGLGVIAAMRTSVNLNILMRRFEEAILQNMAMPGMVLSTDQIIHNQGDRERMRLEWNTLYRGAAKAGKTALLEGGLKPLPITLAPKDLNFLRGRQATFEELANGFGIPLPLLMGREINRATLEAALWQYAFYTIAPRGIRLQQKINQDLLPWFDENLFVAFDDPVPENEEAWLKSMETRLKTGYSSINQIKKEKGEEEVSWGDTPILPMNMIPLGSAPPSPTKEFVEEVSDRVVQKLVSALPQQARGATEKLPSSPPQEHYWPEYSEDITTTSITAYELKYLTREEKRERSFATVLEGIFEQFEKDVLKLIKALTKIPSEYRTKQYDPNLFIPSQQRWEKMLAEEGRLQMELAYEEGGALALEALGMAEIAVDISAEKAVHFLEEYSFRFSREVTQTIQNRLRKELVEGIGKGEGLQALTKRVSVAFEAHVSQKYAEMVARTETVRAMNQGQLAGYETSGVVEGKEWFAAGDARMCPFCEEMEKESKKRIRQIRENFVQKGQTIVAKDGSKMVVHFEDVEAPPLHPRCRCTTLPVTIKGEKVKPIGEEWISAKTIEDAEEWAKKAYPHIEWNFKGLHVEAVNDTLEQFHKLAKQFPEVARNFRRIESMTKEMMREAGDAFAFVSGTTIIRLNPKWYGNPEKFREMLKLAADSQYHPIGSKGIDSVMTHEFGHMLFSRLKETEKTMLSHIKPGRAGGKVSDLVNAWSRKDFKSLPSTYAQYSREEKWAEGFTSMFHTPKKEWAEYTKEQADLLSFLGNEADWVPKGKWRYLDSVRDEEEWRKASEMIARYAEEVKRRFGL